MGFKPLEYVTLEPYERAHATLVAKYRPTGAVPK
jgi:fibrillarin-like rRNA methylase